MQGRSLDGFITWDAIIKIKKYDLSSTYSIGYLISAKTTPLKIKIQLGRVCCPFCDNHNSTYLVHPKKPKIKFPNNKNVFPLVGKINTPFFVKESQSYYIPFWNGGLDKNHKTNNHKPLLNIDLRKTRCGDFVVHVLHGVGIYDGLKTRGVSGFEKEYIKIVYANNGIFLCSFR